MKIQGNGPNQNVEQTGADRVRNESGERGAHARGAARGTGDTVSISSDAELARAAVAAAGDAQTIRTELVERMRKLVESGEAGGDPESLADAIINRLSEE